MGRKIRHTKLKKTNHPYDFCADGKKFSVQIEEDGTLHIFSDQPHIIRGYGAITVLSQDNN